MLAVGALLFWAATSPGAEPLPVILTGFDGESADLGWRIVNDDVMGGRSDSNFRIESGVLIFSGVLNTRGGGFASVRSRPTRFDMTGAQCLELRTLGDGRVYSVGLQTDAAVTYWSELATTPQWRVDQLPFAGFEPRRRGRPLAAPPLDPTAVVGVNLMIADNRDGPFRLEVDWIGVCSSRNASP